MALFKKTNRSKMTLRMKAVSWSDFLTLQENSEVLRPLLEARTGLLRHKPKRFKMQ